LYELNIFLINFQRKTAGISTGNFYWRNFQTFLRILHGPDLAKIKFSRMLIFPSDTKTTFLLNQRSLLGSFYVNFFSCNISITLRGIVTGSNNMSRIENKENKIKKSSHRRKKPRRIDSMFFGILRNFFFFRFFVSS